MDFFVGFCSEKKLLTIVDFKRQAGDLLSYDHHGPEKRERDQEEMSSSLNSRGKNTSYKIVQYIHVLQ